MEAVLMGSALGLFAGIIPGAFLTLVAATALQRGLRQGLTVALLPLGTEIPVLLTAVLVLTRLPEEALRWVGIVGGVLLLYMAWTLVQNARDPRLEQRGAEAPGGHYLRMALVGVLSPSPWVFWFLLGGPLLLNRWYVGPLHGIAFAVAFMACFVGVMAGVAWGAASGGRVLGTAWRRRILFGAGGALVLAAGVLIWQSWVGNFTEFIQAPEEIEERLRGRTG